MTIRYRLRRVYWRFMWLLARHALRNISNY